VRVPLRQDRVTGQDLFPEDLPKVHAGETWAKTLKEGTRLYLVLEADTAGNLTLQNIVMPSSVFRTTADRMLGSGYFLVSQAPYVDLARAKRAKHALKPRRCPYTLDFLEGRADSQVPVINDTDRNLDAGLAHPERDSS
jgi:hypothetical protein